MKKAEGHSRKAKVRSRMTSHVTSGAQYGLEKRNGNVRISELH